MFQVNKDYIFTTYKEIVQFGYENFWNDGIACVDKMSGWQKMSVGELPHFRNLLDKHPDSNSIPAQIALNYIKFRSIYGFAHYIWERVNQLCHELGKSDLEPDTDSVGLAKTAMTIFFQTLDKIDMLDIAEDHDAGFKKLKQAVASFGVRTDFYVMHSIDGPGIWSFLDIVGNISGTSLSDELWKDVLHDTPPTTPNVGGLMESAEDNEKVRY